MLNLLDCDITFSSRRSEYSYDVYVEGCWMASAKNLHNADETADEVQYRAFTDDDPIDIPDEYPNPTPGGPPPPEFAVTLQSLAIEAKLTTCGYCQGIHHVQQCPALRADMAVPVTAEELGGTLCGLLWCDPPGFVQLIARLTPLRRAEYASAYIAFLRTERPDCRLTVPQVIERWLPTVARGGV